MTSEEKTEENVVQGSITVWSGSIEWDKGNEILTDTVRARVT